MMSTVTRGRDDDASGMLIEAEGFGLDWVVVVMVVVMMVVMVVSVVEEVARDQLDGYKRCRSI